MRHRSSERPGDCGGRGENFTWLCEAPFNCDSPPVTPEERARWDNVAWATEDGHSNLRSFCHWLSKPEEMDDVAVATFVALGKTCIQEGDLAAWSSKYYNDLFYDHDFNANYCFAEGLCLIANVTTVEEAEATCDAKYGHENWTSFIQASPEVEAQQDKVRGRFQGSYVGQWGCAAGHFVCDVSMCRNTYCKMKDWAEKYGHYLQEYSTS